MSPSDGHQIFPSLWRSQGSVILGRWALSISVNTPGEFPRKAACPCPNNLSYNTILGLCPEPPCTSRNTWPLSCSHPSSSSALCPCAQPGSLRVPAVLALGAQPSLIPVPVAPLPAPASSPSLQPRPPDPQEPQDYPAGTARRKSYSLELVFCSRAHNLGICKFFFFTESLLYHVNNTVTPHGLCMCFKNVSDLFKSLALFSVSLFCHPVLAFPHL